MITGIFEVAMLLCFAFSWPFNIVRSYKFGTAKGTSAMFLYIVLIGYLFGIANKIVNNDINYVFAFYLLDLALVSCGVLVYLRNLRLDKMAAKGSNT